MTTAEPETADRDNLIIHLAGHDIRYFDGEDCATESPVAPVGPLLVGLARARSSRLRTAIVALLLRHPEYAPTAETVARDLPVDDPARRLLLLSIVIAGALQSEWAFTLDLYLPDQRRIQAEHLANELGATSPRQDYGRPCLAAASRIQGNDDSFPVNYQADWENAAHRLRAQLVREARVNGA